jgi:hypothetical protein
MVSRPGGVSVVTPTPVVDQKPSHRDHQPSGGLRGRKAPGDGRYGEVAAGVKLVCQSHMGHLTTRRSDVPSHQAVGSTLNLASGHQMG